MTNSPGSTANGAGGSAANKAGGIALRCGAPSSACVSGATTAGVASHTAQTTGKDGTALWTPEGCLRRNLHLQLGPFNSGGDGGAARGLIDVRSDGLFFLTMPNQTMQSTTLARGCKIYKCQIFSPAACVR